MNRESPGPVSHVLVLEPDPRGHAREWIEHLITHVETHPSAPRLSVAVADELAAALRPRAGSRVRILRLTSRERWLCTHPALAVSGLARWWTMRRRLIETGAAQGLFLCIDHLSLPLGLGLPTAGRRVSGVLFRPTSHYRAFGCPPAGWRERLRDLHKQVLTRLMLRNPNVDTVFTLDPYFPAYAQQHYGGGDKVLALGDPAHPLPTPDAQERELAARVPPGRTAFVLFGELTERKGVLPLLDALSRLPAEAARSAAVVLAGRLDPAIRSRVAEAVAATRRAQPSLWLKLVDRRLAFGELAAVIERADAVLVPYQRFVGSSGVLLWAAQLRRPVICQDYGLIGEMTRANRLGITVDSSDPEALAEAIATAVQQGPARLGNLAAMAEFLAGRTPESFAEMLLCDIKVRTRTNSVAASGRNDTEWSQRFPV